LTRAGASVTPPAIKLRPTNIGVNIQVRYISRAHERYDLRSRLYAAVVELLRKRNIPESAVEKVPGA
jgi:hypothetical protein